MSEALLPSLKTWERIICWQSPTAGKWQVEIWGELSCMLKPMLFPLVFDQSHTCTSYTWGLYVSPRSLEEGVKGSLRAMTIPKCEALELQNELKHVKCLEEVLANKVTNNSYYCYQ